MKKIFKEFGAGEGNRTLTASLEGWNSTVELHPQRPRKNKGRLSIGDHKFCNPGFGLGFFFSDLLDLNQFHHSGEPLELLARI